MESTAIPRGPLVAILGINSLGFYSSVNTVDTSTLLVVIPSWHCSISGYWFHHSRLGPEDRDVCVKLQSWRSRDQEVGDMLSMWWCHTGDGYDLESHGPRRFPVIWGAGTCIWIMDRLSPSILSMFHSRHSRWSSVYEMDDPTQMLAYQQFLINFKQQRFWTQVCAGKQFSRLWYSRKSIMRRVYWSGCSVRDDHCFIRLP